MPTSSEFAFRATATRSNARLASALPRPAPFRLPGRSGRRESLAGENAPPEGAIFATAALRVLGFPPLILDLEADQDTDHVIAVFKIRGHWGAVAKSNFVGCRYREPVHRTLRELALSYFNTYFNLRGERTLRRYSHPVNLARFDPEGWMTSEKAIWFIPEYLCDIPHRQLLRRGLEKHLTRVDRRTWQSEMVGHRKKK